MLHRLFLLLAIGSWLLAVLAVSVLPALANTAEPLGNEISEQMTDTGTGAGFVKADEFTMAATVGSIINGSLGILGVLFLALTVFAGYLWLTAGGEEEQIKKAKDYLRNGLIGMVIVLAAFGVSHFVVNSIINSTLAG